MTPGKGKAARRLVPLNSESVDILRQHLTMARWKAPENFVWSAGNGRPMNAANALRRVIEPLAVKLGMPEFDLTPKGIHV